MTDILTPSPKQQFFDNNGNPAVGWKLFTYQAGTTTKLATHTDSTGLANNTNPIILDYRGEANIWIPANTPYKYVLAPPTDTDPPTHAVWTVDQVRSSQLLTLYGGVDTGTPNNYVLTFAANFTSYTDGIVIYWIPSNTNTGGSTLNVNGLGAIPLLTADGLTLGAGDIIQNQITGVLYRTGSFYLLSISIATGSFVGTLTGVSGTVTGTIFYKISGGMCTLYTSSNIVGASTTVAMGITGVPAIARPAIQIQIPCEVLNDSIAALGFAAVGTGGGITFGTYRTSGAAVIPSPFVAANNKGIQTGWSVTYPL